MFEKILVANRGEIACRVIRTCRRLGIRSVAVYSDADAEALHVTLADEAHHIGPAAPKESYLRGGRIIEVARRVGADAIHPGFGFLSENPGFARACRDAGIVFIGPPAEAISAMGSKQEAKKIMEKAGVPVVPGYHGDQQAPDVLAREAANIGYPVLLKASSGGGGKGMRRVDSAAEFQDALAAAKREAQGAFGDDHMIIEKYIERPRHIEIQVFADSQGNCIHLFERECSIQRRHQKIVEEAPSVALDAKTRAAMGASAVEAARAVGYRNAGTVEFIFDDDGNYYFMEMNTRLQVEHPVTEMITGVDLVEWQIDAAAGRPMQLDQDRLAISGHAIEVRVYAENPEKEFLPTVGRLSRYQLPEENVHVRVDTGVREGDTIGSDYDPMIAKLIVWDADRSTAIRRMKKALLDYTIAGTITNLNFLSSVIGHQAFEEGRTDTGFVQRHLDDLLHGTRSASHRVLALATLYVLLSRHNHSARMAETSADPYSPWHLRTGWRLNEQYQHQLTFLDWGKEVQVTVHFLPGLFSIEFSDACVEANGQLHESGDLMAVIDGSRVKATVVQHGHEITVVSSEGTHRLLLQDPVAMDEEESASGTRIAASMPGTVTKVHVAKGDTVERGQALIVLEAMKMEHTMTANADGVVAAVHFSAGDRVSEDEILIELESDEE